MRVPARFHLNLKIEIQRLNRHRFGKRMRVYASTKMSLLSFLPPPFFFLQTSRENVGWISPVPEKVQFVDSRRDCATTLYFHFTSFVGVPRKNFLVVETSSFYWILQRIFFFPFVRFLSVTPRLKSLLKNLNFIIKIFEGDH